MTVTSSCASLLIIETSTTGLIFSNYNGTYLNNMNCNWTISSNAKLELAFIRFQIESGYDFVKVYDGPTSSSTLIGEYDGDSLPTLITSSSHELFMSFTSDGSVTNPGFLANYHSEYKLFFSSFRKWECLVVNRLCFAYLSCNFNIFLLFISAWPVLCEGHKFMSKPSDCGIICKWYNIF